MFDTLYELDLVWLHLMLMRPCSDVTIWEASSDVGLLFGCPSLFHSVRWYAYHACLCHPLAYVHLYTLSYISRHQSCLLVSSILQHKEAMDIRSKPTLSLADTTFCLLAFLFVFLLSWPFVYLCLSCLRSHAMLAISILLVYFVPFAHYNIFLSIVCLLVSCLCLCMYTQGARTLGARAQSLRHKQKGHGCKHLAMSRAAMFSRFRSLVFSHSVMYSFKTASFLFTFSLRWVVLGISCYVPFVLISRV